MKPEGAVCLLRQIKSWRRLVRPGTRAPIGHGGLNRAGGRQSEGVGWRKHRVTEGDHVAAIHRQAATGIDFADLTPGRGTARKLLVRRVDAFEGIILQPDFGLDARAHAVVVTGTVEIIIVAVHAAKTHARHAFHTQGAPPIMMEGDVQLAGIFRRIVVAVADQVHEIMAGVGRVLEFAPRDRDIVRPVRDIQAAVTALGESAMRHPDVSRAVDRQTVTIACAAGIREFQVLEDNIVFEPANQIADES